MTSSTASSSLLPGFEPHHIEGGVGLQIHTLVGGHCVAEEVPDALLARVLPFLNEGKA